MVYAGKVNDRIKKQRQKTLRKLKQRRKMENVAERQKHKVGFDF